MEVHARVNFYSPSSCKGFPFRQGWVIMEGVTGNRAKGRAGTALSHRGKYRQRRIRFMGKNMLIAQSGGPTAAINASLSGAVQQARMQRTDR